MGSALRLSRRIGKYQLEWLESRTLLSGDAEMVKDIRTGSGNSSPERGIVFGGVLLFQATGDSGTRGLWVSNGTTNGTIQLKSIRPVYGMVEFNGAVYLAADDGINGVELWKTDGTVEGTELVKDIRTGPDSSSPHALAVVDDTLFFVADDGLTGRELWKTDGSAAGTQLVKDIRSGSPSSCTPYDHSPMVSFGQELFFIAEDVKGWELWKSDGTADGTVRVTDFPGDLHSFDAEIVIFNNQLYFPANDGSHGAELWRSNGVPGNQTMVADILPGSQTAFGGLSPSFTVVNGALFFLARVPEFGVELWKTDGTTTALVKDIRPGSSDAMITGMQELNSVLLFSADDGVHGQEIWRSDGTTDGTALVRDIRPGTGGATDIDFLSPYLLSTRVGSEVFFRAMEPVVGTASVWKTDGTADGTVMVADRGTFALGAVYTLFTSMNGYLYLAAAYGTTGRELWRVDLSSSAPPTILSAKYLVDRRVVQLGFSEAVAAIDLADLTIRLAGSQQPVISAITATAAPHAHILELSIDPSLPAGSYELVIPAGVVQDLAGNPMAAFTFSTTTPASNDFFILPGDANRDRKVSTQDFNVLAANFGTTTTFSKGNFDYTGIVDSVDFGVFLSHYGVSLVQPVSASGTPSLFAVERCSATMKKHFLSSSDGKVSSFRSESLARELAGTRCRG